MGDIKISVSVSLVVAVVVAEVVSAICYSDALPWGRHSPRYFLSGLVCDFGLAVFLQYIMASHWSVRCWEDAGWLALWLSLLYASLEAPHAVYNHKSFSRFFFHAVHKFLVIFAVVMTLYYFKKHSPLQNWF